jgi:hypothetical protein
MEIRTIGYWAATVLAALLFAVPGAALVVGVPHFVDDMAHLGYPGYFPGFLGVWKILAAAAILIPGYARLKEWAYAGMMFDISGALASRAAMGDGGAVIVVPIGIAVVVAASWSLRPADRRLASLSPRSGWSAGAKRAAGI